MTLSVQPLRTALADPAHQPLAARLETFARELDAAAGPNLVSLVIFGGVARGRYREGRSDVNVLLVLERAGRAELEAVAPALNAAWRAARVEPMIVTRAQVAGAAAAFPTKFLDIKTRHIRVGGEDVLGPIEVPRERILWRIHQELQNLAIRLRRRYTGALGDPARLAEELAAIARPLAIELGCLLRAHGRNVPDEDRTAAVFAAAAGAFSLDGEALAALAALRQDPGASADHAELAPRIIDSILRAGDASSATP